MTDECGIALTASDWRVGHSRHTWEWLQRALKDVGQPVVGWSYYRYGTHCSFTMRGPAEKVRDAILDLWANERPGGAVEVAVIYG